MHHNARWYIAYLRILRNFCADGSLGYPQIGQSGVRPSLHQPLGPVSVSRRSAAASCADAQACRHEAVSASRCSHVRREARSRLERLVARRACQKHGNEAAGRAGIAAGAVGAVGEERLVMIT